MSKRITHLLLVIATLSFLIGCKIQDRPNEIYDDVDSWLVEVKQEVDVIGVTQLNDLWNTEKMFILIDVRTLTEHDEAYIPGSILIPRGLLEFRINNKDFWEEEGLYEPAKDEMIVLYCRSGNRSAFATQTLKKLGFTNVFSLEGGFTDWKQEYPDLIEFNTSPIDPSEIGPSIAEEEGGTC